MAFEDDLAQCLQGAGIDVEAGTIPSQDAVAAALDRLQGFLNSLDDTTRKTLDQVTADFPVKQGLADPSVGVAPELADFLQACDEIQASLSISAIVDQLNTCMKNVS